MSKNGICESKIGTCEHITKLNANRAGEVVNKYRQYINKVQENGSMCKYN